MKLLTGVERSLEKKRVLKTLERAEMLEDLNYFTEELQASLDLITLSIENYNNKLDKCLRVKRKAWVKLDELPVTFISPDAEVMPEIAFVELSYDRWRGKKNDEAPKWCLQLAEVEIHPHCDAVGNYISESMTVHRRCLLQDATLQERLVALGKLPELVKRISQRLHKLDEDVGAVIGEIEKADALLLGKEYISSALVEK